MEDMKYIIHYMKLSQRKEYLIMKVSESRPRLGEAEPKMPKLSEGFLTRGKPSGLNKSLLIFFSGKYKTERRISWWKFGAEGPAG